MKQFRTLTTSFTDPGDIEDCSEVYGDSDERPDSPFIVDDDCPNNPCEHIYTTIEDGRTCTYRCKFCGEEFTG